MEDRVENNGGGQGDGLQGDGRGGEQEDERGGRHDGERDSEQGRERDSEQHSNSEDGNEPTRSTREAAPTNGGGSGEETYSGSEDSSDDDSSDEDDEEESNPVGNIAEKRKAEDNPKDTRPEKLPRSQPIPEDEFDPHAYLTDPTALVKKSKKTKNSLDQNKEKKDQNESAAVNAFR